MASEDHTSFEETDGEAVAKTLEDQEHFSVLIGRYTDKLERYIWRLGISNSEDREDILQNVFIAAYRNLRSFDQGMSFSSWIYRIAHNESMSWYRKSAVRREHMRASDSEQLLDLLAGEESASHGAMTKELEVALQSALMDIDARYRDVLLLRFFEEKTYEEISDILQVPSGTVATLVRRGKERLREMLVRNNYI